ncbi:hypothetical protein A0H81_05085 [Grifola frondosa]|uniref:F-box domain-containing protein n=1 Tax=Grifola frondosa TaxID=5627 RepID=A0A1C7MDG2_GRIFR|nr:hypothetical protein A0H81_05085 [Grifola frondosa]
MPFDILFEILALLSSRDLIALAYINKGFRQYLASPAASTMWKTARESTVGMPACAPYLSEFHWADLLWGKKCQQCGMKGAAVVSFALLRRCCALCKKTHLVDLKMFMELFPDVDTSILALVPHMMGPGSIGMTEYYWDDDIRDMSWRLVALEAKTSLGTARLSDAVKTFMGEQRVRVTAIMNHAAMCESVFAVRKSKKEVLERLRALIVTCGHNYLDACRAVSLEHYIVQSTSQSILTIWQRERSHLLQKADDAKQYRLNQARLEIIKTRHLLVRKLYNVFVFGAFAALIEDVIDIEEAHFVNAMARLPELSRDGRITEHRSCLDSLRGLLQPIRIQSNWPPRFSPALGALSTPRLDLKSFLSIMIRACFTPIVALACPSATEGMWLRHPCSVVDHVEAQHAVDEPEEGRDFFRDPRKIRPEPRRGYIVVDPDRPDYDGDARIDGKPYICL